MYYATEDGKITFTLEHERYGIGGIPTGCVMRVDVDGDMGYKSRTFTADALADILIECGAIPYQGDTVTSEGGDD